MNSIVPTRGTAAERQYPFRSAVGLMRWGTRKGSWQITAKGRRALDAQTTTGGAAAKENRCTAS